MDTSFFESYKDPLDVNDHLFALAIHDIEHDKVALSRLGIVKQKGTILVSRIIDGEHLWIKHRSDMMKCWRRYESQLQKLVEIEHKGIIVKTCATCFVCFFPEKSEKLCHSVTDAISVAFKIHKGLRSDDPIQIGDSTDTLKVKIAICYGPCYKRSVHVQKRTLADYCGGIMDEAYRALECFDQSNELPPDSLDGLVIVKSEYLDTPPIGKPEWIHVDRAIVNI